MSRIRALRYGVAGALLALLLLLAATARSAERLWFTAPTHSVDSVSAPCEGSIDVLRAPIHVRMYANAQSRTWQDSAASLLADTAGWRRLWPQVRMEAAARMLRFKLEEPGAADSMIIPLGPWLAVWLVPFKPWNSLEGCPTSKVQVPPAPSLLVKPPPPAPAAVSEGFDLAPAPATSALVVTIGAGDGPARLQVFDLGGRLLVDLRWPLAIRRRLTLDVRAWPPGLYFARLQIGQYSRTRRVVVVR